MNKWDESQVEEEENKSKATTTMKNREVYTCKTYIYIYKYIDTIDNSADRLGRTGKNTCGFRTY